MKHRVTFTIQDYYDYVGTHPFGISMKNRVLSSIPSDRLKESMYNLKFRIIKSAKYSRYYRISLSTRLDKEEIDAIFDKAKTYCHFPTNIVVKEITKGR